MKFKFSNYDENILNSEYWEGLFLLIVLTLRV